MSFLFCERGSVLLRVFDLRNSVLRADEVGEYVSRARDSF